MKKIRSVYEELGYKNYKEMETKSNITMKISEEIKKKKFTRAIAAKILGVTQPELSSLLRGHFTEYSVDHLKGLLKLLVDKKPISELK